MKEVSYKLPGKLLYLTTDVTCLFQKAGSVLQESLSSLWLVGWGWAERVTQICLSGIVSQPDSFELRKQNDEVLCAHMHEKAAKPACPGRCAAGNWDYSAHLHQVEGTSLCDGQSCDLFFMSPGVPCISWKRLEFFQYYSHHLFSFFSFFT